MPQTNASKKGVKADTAAAIIADLNWPTDKNGRPKKWLTSSDLARLFGVQPSSVTRWRTRGDGPAFVSHPAGRILYQRESVEAYVRAITKEGQAL